MIGNLMKLNRMKLRRKYSSLDCASIFFSTLSCLGTSIIRFTLTAEKLPFSSNNCDILFVQNFINCLEQSYFNHSLIYCIFCPTKSHSILFFKSTMVEINFLRSTAHFRNFHLSRTGGLILEWSLMYRNARTYMQVFVRAIYSLGSYIKICKHFLI